MNFPRSPDVSRRTTEAFVAVGVVGVVAYVLVRTLLILGKGQQA